MSALEWRRIRRREWNFPEEFLREQEARCVSACARYLRPERSDHLWVLPDIGTPISALLFQSRRTLFPIAFSRDDVPVPPFIERFLLRIPIHAVQGETGDTRILEDIMFNLGYQRFDYFDYDLMNLNHPPNADCFSAGPQSLTIRRAEITDVDKLYPLQASYEREEVLPQKAEFNPVGCRLNLVRIIAQEITLLASINGRFVGKINTSAESFTRTQMGGVYVHPDYRGQGIAKRLTAALCAEITRRGREVSLFVKKRNAAARGAYRRVGFEAIGNYRISYFYS